MKTLIMVLVSVAVIMMGANNAGAHGGGYSGGALSDRCVKQLKAQKLSKPKVQPSDAAVKN